MGERYCRVSGILLHQTNARRPPRARAADYAAEHTYVAFSKVSNKKFAIGHDYAARMAKPGQGVGHDYAVGATQ